MTTGLFSDSAVIRRITREAIVLAAAGRAILLQVAHPKVALGVHEHSDFAADPLGRLRGTLSYVYGTVFGSREEAERIGRAVRAMHASVTGPGYRALDPDLQVWVGITLFDSGVDIHRRVFGPLSPSEWDEAREQYAVLATALGCPRELWPANRAEYTAYWERMISELTVSDEARLIAEQIFRPRQWWLRPLTALQRLLTAGLLPEPLRVQYGLPWSPARRRAFTAAFAITSRVYPHLPVRLRELPKNHYLRGLRRGHLPR